MSGGRLGFGAALAAAVAAGLPGPALAHGPVLRDRFDRPNGPNGLIANEYAYRNPGDPRAVRSPSWVATSGSLFVVHGVGSSGVPDGCRPDLYSRACNDSAVFRLHSRRFDFRDVTVVVRLINHFLTSTPRTPPTAHDGVHLWLRYQSERELYALSVNRRDGAVVVKKKCPGGPSNGGTYVTLGRALAKEPILFGVWQTVAASIRTRADGSVAIALARNGRLLVTALDRGVGCAPITGAGAVGIRGDNDDFGIDELAVTKLSSRP